MPERGKSTPHVVLSEIIRSKISFATHRMRTCLHNTQLDFDQSNGKQKDVLKSTTILLSTESKGCRQPASQPAERPQDQSLSNCCNQQANLLLTSITVIFVPFISPVPFPYSAGHQSSTKIHTPKVSNNMEADTSPNLINKLHMFVTVALQNFPIII